MKTPKPIPAQAWADLAREARHVQDPIPEGALTAAQYAQRNAIALTTARNFLVTQWRAGRLGRACRIENSNRTYYYWPLGGPNG